MIPHVDLSQLMDAKEPHIREHSSKDQRASYSIAAGHMH
jgi:hypothetical protein